MIATARVLTTGNSQAIRLPKAFRVEVAEMWISRNEATQAQTTVTSVICRAELRYGQSLMARDDKRRKAIDLMLHELPALPWTAAAADRYGEIQAHLKRQGTPIGELDTQIAAHALAEDLILVTDNTRHFEKVPGLKLEDWMG